MTNASNIQLPTLEHVIADISRVLEESGLTPSELTVRKYSKNGGKYDGRFLRRFGGFAAIIAEGFASDKDKDLPTTRYLQRRRSYVSNLEKELSDWAFLRNSVFESFERAFKQVEPFRGTQIHKSDKPRVVAMTRANVVVISDTHMGLRISPEEILTNGYDWRIAARRLGKMCMQGAEFKLDHRDECAELHVCLGGDLGQGLIHYQSDNGTDLITYQITGIVSYIVQALDYWRKSYSRVIVHCVPDNHMRLTHKGPDRTTAQKFDSFATMIYLGLQMAFRTCPDVQFDIPKTAIDTFDVLGHKFGLTHGDTHIDTGNVGQTINIKAISTQALKLNAAVRDGRPYECLILCHVHTPLSMPLAESNTELVVNGTMSGTDGFSDSIGYYRTTPYQVMFECTQPYVVGDFRKVRLDDADEDPSFERIIKPYNYELMLK
jgi:hypothetical protein